MTARPRKTLVHPTEPLRGIGLHTGAQGRVQLFPADNIQGIVFRREQSGAILPADAAHVVNTSRCTVLGSEDFSVQTAEHLLSACAGMGLTDATILVQGPEVPILDGSALPFAEAIAGAGLVGLSGALDALTLDAPIALTQNGATIIAYPETSRSVSVIIDYPDHPAIGAQAAIHLGVNYLTDVAPARTYGFLSEIESLQSRGLAMGAAFDTGIALQEDGAPDARTPLRFVNELARHKLLDVLGDLALAGKDLQIGVVAIRPSHALNTRFARLLAQTGRESNTNPEE